MRRHLLVIAISIFLSGALFVSAFAGANARLFDSWLDFERVEYVGTKSASDISLSATRLRLAFFRDDTPTYDWLDVNATRNRIIRIGPLVWPRDVTASFGSLRLLAVGWLGLALVVWAGAGSGAVMGAALARRFFERASLVDRSALHRVWTPAPAAALGAAALAALAGASAWWLTFDRTQMARPVEVSFEPTEAAWAIGALVAALLAVSVGAIHALWHLRPGREGSSVARRVCWSCGYPVEGLAGQRCPECGRTRPPPAVSIFVVLPPPALVLAAAGFLAWILRTDLQDIARLQAEPWRYRACSWLLGQPEWYPKYLSAFITNGELAEVRFDDTLIVIGAWYVRPKAPPGNQKWFVATLIAQPVPGTTPDRWPGFKQDVVIRSYELPNVERAILTAAGEVQVRILNPRVPYGGGPSTLVEVGFSRAPTLWVRRPGGYHADDDVRAAWEGFLQELDARGLEIIRVSP